jgi:photosystem II stability/assembly factor-like uncharacterized protein
MKKIVAVLLACLVLAGCGPAALSPATPVSPTPLAATPTASLITSLSPRATSPTAYTSSTPHATATLPRLPTMTRTLAIQEVPSSLFGPEASLTALAGMFPSTTPTPVPTLLPGEKIVLTWIDMRPAGAGWAIEASGKIVHTRDGGSTWKDVTPTPDRYVPGGFFALDAQRAWATPFVGGGMYSVASSTSPRGATLWHTTDGGASWQPSPALCLSGLCGAYYDVSPAFIDPLALQFLDESHGWMLLNVEHHMFQDRYRVFRTTDGGSTWEFLSDNMTGPMAMAVTGLAFQDDRTGWLGVDQMGGAASPSADWGLYRSGDGGKTWQYRDAPAPQALPPGTSPSSLWCGTSSLNFLPPSTLDTTVVCTTFDYSSPAPYPYYYFHFHSPDGGASWRSWQATGAVDFASARVGWRIEDPGVGQVKQLQQTLDGGATWSTVDRVAWPQTQLDFLDNLEGWGLVGSGEEAVIVHSLDGGRSWSQVVPLAAP